MSEFEKIYAFENFDRFLLEMLNKIKPHITESEYLHLEIKATQIKASITKAFEIDDLFKAHRNNP